jgi:hypothetical protein
LKLLSFFFALVYAIGLALVLPNGDIRISGSLALLFSIYTVVCSIRDYYNPMLLGLMVLAYGIALFAILPGTNAADWTIPSTGRSSTLFPFSSSIQLCIILALCIISNTILMFTGFRKAKMPGYNHEFTVSGKIRN